MENNEKDNLTLDEEQDEILTEEEQENNDIDSSLDSNDDLENKDTKEDKKDSETDEEFYKNLSEMLTNSLKDALGEDDIKNIKLDKTQIMKMPNPGQVKTNKYVEFAVYCILSVALGLAFAFIGNFITVGLVSFSLYVLLTSFVYYIGLDVLMKFIKIPVFFIAKIISFVFKLALYLGFYYILREPLGIEITNIFGTLIAFIIHSLCLSALLQKFITFEQTLSFIKVRNNSKKNKK